MDDIHQTAADHTDYDRSVSLRDENPTGLESFDKWGDLILTIGPLRLLVSSVFLLKSCAFFERMLVPDAFLEGMNQPNTEKPPVIILEDGDPQAFRQMCKIVHFQQVEPPESVEELRSLADVADFYGCQQALAFHVRAWASSWSITTLTTRQLQDLLGVAFVFHLGDAFEVSSRNLAVTMTASELDSWDVHPMPPSLKSTCRRSIRLLVDRILT
jgi:hypothetical protein